jgi:hypothetical protein
MCCINSELSTENKLIMEDNLDGKSFLKAIRFANAIEKKHCFIVSVRKHFIHILLKNTA